MHGAGGRLVRPVDLLPAVSASQRPGWQAVMGRLLDRVAPLYWPQQRLMYRSRRARLILRAELLARLVGSRIQTELARDVELGRRIAIDVQPGTRNRLTNGRSTSVGNDAVLRFQGGDLTVGSNTIIRSGLRLETSGRLTIGDGAYIGHGSFLHCASSTTIDDFVVLSEYATVTDSTHVRTSLDTSVLPNVRVSDSNRPQRLARGPRCRDRWGLCGRWSI